jgi:hypothetical protein
LARQFEGRVRIIGVPGDDTVEAMRAFVERYDLGHVTQAADLDRDVRERMGVAGQPVWVFLDGGTGTLTRAFYPSEEEVLRQLETLAAG